MSVSVCVCNRGTICRTTIIHNSVRKIFDAFCAIFHVPHTTESFRQTDCLWIFALKKSQVPPSPDPDELRQSSRYRTQWTRRGTTHWSAHIRHIMRNVSTVTKSPPVNFQYLMSWWGAAASGNPQWCDWWISQYSDLFSNKLTWLAGRHGLSDHINP